METKGLKEQTTLLLHEISNLILISKNRTINPGLYSGLSGAVVYLYNTGRILGNESIVEAADRTLLKIISQISDCDHSFTDGLSGVGWTLLDLFENDFIDIDSSEPFFAQIDSKLIQNVSDFDFGVEAVGAINYYLNRLRLSENKDDDVFRQMESKAIGCINKICDNRLLREVKDIDDISRKINREKDFGFFLEAVDQIHRISHILNNEISHKIHQEVIAELRVYYHHKALICLHVFPYLIAAKDNDNIKNMLGKLETQFYKAYQVYVNLSSEKNSLLGMGYFVKIFLDKIVLMKGQSTIISDKTYIEASILQLTLLQELFFTVADNVIEHLLIDKQKAILLKLSNQKEIIRMSFGRNNVSDYNIGLLGLSGLGLSLMQMTSDSKLSKWKQALFI